MIDPGELGPFSPTWKIEKKVMAQIMKTVTVETFGVDYPEPEKV